MPLPIPPEYLLPLPQGFIYLGIGGTFEVPEGGFRGCTIHQSSKSAEHWTSGHSLIGLYQELHYAVPFDSEIARLNGFPEVPNRYKFVGWKPGPQEYKLCAYVPHNTLSFLDSGMDRLYGDARAYYFTAVEDSDDKDTNNEEDNAMKRLKITINGDVDVYDSGGKVAEVSADSVQDLIDWLGDRPTITGEIPRFDNIVFGCQSFSESELDEFLDEYAREDWKKPPEEKYSLGAKFIWPDKPDAVYTLCAAGAGQAILVNADNGGRLSNVFSLKLSEREWTLQEIIDAVGCSDIINLRAAS